MHADSTRGCTRERTRSGRFDVVNGWMEPLDSAHMTRQSLGGVALLEGRGRKQRAVARVRVIDPLSGAVRGGVESLDCRRAGLAIGDTLPALVVDGKALRGTRSRHVRAMMVIAALDVATDCVFSQVAVDPENLSILRKR